MISNMRYLAGKYTSAEYNDENVRIEKANLAAFELSLIHI